MISLVAGNGHTQPESMTWNKVKLAKFTRLYKKSVKNKVHTFTFDEHEFSTSYAGYLIEYLKGRLK